MSLTSQDVTAWRNELATMIDDVADESSRAALTNLHSALAPYFDNPEYFRTMLSKIQRAFVPDDVETEITSRAFADLDELKALLPEDVTITTIR